MNIVWLRRDLQIADNASIHAAGKVAAQAGAKPLCVFVFDTDILANFPNKRDRRISFLANALAQIDAQLRAKNSQLLVLSGSAKQILPQLATALVGKIFAGEDYEPSAIARDEFVAKNAPLQLSKQHVLVSPRAVLKDDGSPYKVFTPYSNNWRSTLTEFDCLEFDNSAVQFADFDTVLKKIEPLNLQILDASNPQKMVADIGYEFVPDEQWQVQNGQKMLDLFIAEKIDQYAATRDIPAIYGTSRLSPYLRFGLVTIRQAYNATHRAQVTGTWVNELIWREFYAMILLQFPHTTNTEFQAQYRGLKWHQNADWLERWKQGQTGYPLVDAGMRELLQTGWMHNRMRMVVASFLTKNLLLDWRVGEEHFAQYLMDYDLASNVGGWQWASSTGTDAAPYFRMFSPISQSKRFDPEGEYIRRYVPELELLPTKDLHEPWLRAKPANYPAPMVDHATSRALVMEFFKTGR